MQLDEQTVRKVAKNARLALTEEEVHIFVDDFRSILKAFASISEVDTTDVPLHLHPVELKALLRNDSAGTSLRDPTASVKNKDGSHFKGPRVA